MKTQQKITFILLLVQWLSVN